MNVVTGLKLTGVMRLPAVSAKADTGNEMKTLSADVAKLRLTFSSVMSGFISSRVTTIIPATSSFTVRMHPLSVSEASLVELVL